MKEAQALKPYEFKTPEVKKAAELLTELYIAVRERQERKKDERKRKPSS